MMCGNARDLAGNCLQLRPGIPVILASGFIEEAIREEAGSLGVREILGKTLTAQVLAEGVHRTLAKPAK